MEDLWYKQFGFSTEELEPWPSSLSCQRNNQKSEPWPTSLSCQCYNQKSIFHLLIRSIKIEKQAYQLATKG
jgi:hypothetical protein